MNGSESSKRRHNLLSENETDTNKSSKSTFSYKKLKKILGNLQQDSVGKKSCVKRNSPKDKIDKTGKALS